jgi:predicted ribosome quality control (RQC) complex YloA/Tae2 family protein
MKIIETMPRVPVLSSRDLEALTPLLDQELRDGRVERVFVPEFILHPDGYLKRTFVIELHQRTKSCQLYVSLRSGECGIVVLPPKSLRPAATAPRSGFELSLSKHLPGTRLDNVRQIAGDRVLMIEFHGPTPFELALHLIPGKPSGILLAGETRDVIQSTDQRSSYQIPLERTLTEDELRKIPAHPEWTRSLRNYADLWRVSEGASLLKTRHGLTQKKIDHDSQALKQKIRSLEIQLDSTEKEEDWSRYGILLQIHLHETPAPRNGFYEFPDPETGETQKLPANPKLSPEQQLNRYFHQAKRKKKRLHETKERLVELSSKLQRLDQFKEQLARTETLSELLAIEKNLGIGSPAASGSRKKEERQIAEFTGRVYRSKEGLLILAGRNLNENLMLTFKIAKGNDLWLHVKGRPGSHTVILLPPNRTASLETLLDAAHLCILHSGGKDWGKTEVDYTHRKFVKKIKNQTEVSYSGNRTLSIVLEEARLKRLQEALG